MGEVGVGWASGELPAEVPDETAPRRASSAKEGQCATCTEQTKQVGSGRMGERWGWRTQGLQAPFRIVGFISKKSGKSFRSIHRRGDDPASY